MSSKQFQDVLKTFDKLYCLFFKIIKKSLWTRKNLYFCLKTTLLLCPWIPFILIVSFFLLKFSYFMILQWLVVHFPSTMDVRRVEKTVLSVEQSEGVGARVRRSIGRKEVFFLWRSICKPNIYYICLHPLRGIFSCYPNVWYWVI